MTTPVPDDVVRSLDLNDCRLSVYDRASNVNAVTIRFVGPLPLKVGERVEVEVVEIERSVVER